jgi:putative tryptophan/tyrosine transport system substrate-binding protein
MIGRRAFITLLGGAAGFTVAWPFAVSAQKLPVIGILGTGSAEPFANRIRALHQGLRESDYVEGRNVAVESRWADGQYERLPALADDLARRQAAVIATIGGVPAARAASNDDDTDCIPGRRRPGRGRTGREP